MPAMHYRLYYFADGGNCIERALDLDCEDDAAAIQRAEDQADGRAMDIWRGNSRIGRLPADVKRRKSMHDRHA
jgi:hypothetical protein